MAYDINDYTIGKGVCSISTDGVAWTDLGNCPVFEFTPDVKLLDHYSSRTGVKTKDFTAVQELSGKLKIKFDSINDFNMGLALLAQDGLILANALAYYYVRFIGGNTIGNQITTTFPKVLLTPNSAIPFINDGFMEVDLDGQVLANDSGVFGSYSFAT